MTNSLLSNKHLLKTKEPLLRIDKKTMNVGRVKKPCFLSFALGLSHFIRTERLAYLTSMSMQSTWADGIIQAVADNLNLKIHITESLPNFAEFTVVEAATPRQQLSTIYIGHLDEFHYLSTKHLVPYICPLKRGTLEVPADAKQLNNHALLI